MSKIIETLIIMFFEMFNAKKQERKRWSEYSKIHVSKPNAHLQRSRYTCLLDFNELSFYDSPNAI